MESEESGAQMNPRVTIVIVTILSALICATAIGQQERPLIAEVTVEGNDFVSRDAILDTAAEVLKVGEEFTATKGAEARRLVMRMGYFDEVVLSTEQLERGVRVVITVVEKQRLEQIMFAGNTVISDEALASAIVSQPGHIADETAIGRDVQRIEDRYEARGYIAKVSEAKVDELGVLTFVIEEARIEDIMIEGLNRTEDWVVRRELDIEPGELFHQEEVTTGIRRVYALGLFEDVEMELRPGTENPLRDVILVIGLTEARTGRAAFALGWSSLDNLVVMLSAEERNLRGRGERASVGLELGGRESYQLSYFMPYLDERGTTVELNLYDSERRRQFVGGAAITTADSEFDERRTGGDMTVIRPITDRRRVSMTVRSVEVSSSFFQGSRIVSPADGGGVGGIFGASLTGAAFGGDGTSETDGSGLMPTWSEPGEIDLPIEVRAPLHPGGRVNSITVGIIDDTRDVRVNPRSGTWTSVSFEQAGAMLGGGTEFGKLSLEHRYYLSLGDDVVAMRLMGGTTLGSTPLYESFSVGGANTLRGYDLDRWRGESLLLGNVEYRRPITDALTAVGFVDIGSAFGGDFETVVPGFSIPAKDRSFTPHVGTGVGIRVVTPIGPIRLDMGFGEDGSQAHFGFGHTF